MAQKWGNAELRQASLSDVDRLVALMAEFYAESSYPLNTGKAAKAFHDLIADERLGRVWLIQSDGREAGYIVITVGYSMEFGGLDAFIDDLFIRPAFRHCGLGTAAVNEARAYCEARGIRAMHLEVAPENEVAMRVYRKAGFASTGRQLLTLSLASPTHDD